MEMVFDISQEEMPIFMAETDEQMQILDEGLVRLEKEQEDSDLLQALFRAAHTLKGTAGMIGHKRMVSLTHALETALDGVRKHTLDISTELIDACLEGVDALRLLRDEVSIKKASAIEIDPLVERFNLLVESGTEHKKNNKSEMVNGKGTSDFAGVDKSTLVLKPGEALVNIQAEIAKGSVASAARAFQLMLALQDFGTILYMEPTQDQIETAQPVHLFNATVVTAYSTDNIRKALIAISEIDRIVISEEGGKPEEEKEAASAQAEEKASHLGDFLVKRGYITQASLTSALSEQRKGDTWSAPLLGQVLVKMGVISQDVLNEALIAFNQSQERPGQSAVIQPSVVERAKEKEHVAEKTVRTSVERLDNLMNLVGELITDRSRLTQIRGKFNTQIHGDERIEALSETITHISRITDQLQEEVMHIRMLPISNVFNKFPRMVRDLSQKAGKDIDLIIRGEDTELDRSVIEEINDPIIHLLRNSIDHGVEKPAERLSLGKARRGVIMLTAHHEQGRIVITVEDDGRGIDAEKLKQSAVQKGLIGEAEAAALSRESALDLIFLSGLSTAKTVTDISGRGVGMDIVRNNIERINGSIQVETWEGRGTQVQIILPLTLAIVPTLLVKVGTSTFAIPLATVMETLRISEENIQTVNSKPVILLRDHILTLARLSDIFDLPKSDNNLQYQYVVVVRSGKNQLGLMVDDLVGEEDVVVKSLGALVGEVPGISSAAILGDGQIALIIDVMGLYKVAGVYGQ
jgi:two-component system chemotaxis sensor kinase CheA